jgi:CDP-4-dehydro-6-deoxyglucose reductase
MTSIVTIQSSGQRFPVESGESLLDAALRAGIPLSYSCNSGSCGNCRARVVRGRCDPLRHHDYILSGDERGAGVVLLCCAGTGCDLEIETRLADNPAAIPLQHICTTVSRLEPVTDDTLVLHLRTPRSRTLQFLAGQHVTLTIPGLAPRNKSIASCPCNGLVLQFHIRRVPGDAFSDYVFSHLQLRQPVEVSGPKGEFVLDSGTRNALIFVAYDTGFAPIKSLMEHAISLELNQPITLYWAARPPAGHYLENHCRAWQDALDNFRYESVTAAPPGPVLPAAENLPAQQLMHAVMERLLEDHPVLTGHDVYVSSAGVLTEEHRARLLRHGLAGDRLFVDALERY